uniref:ZM domain-containing protein n=1 Tax=Syphacia muris TaxID=451379 RepID=A0A0N5ARW4_9BILA
MHHSSRSSTLSPLQKHLSVESLKGAYLAQIQKDENRYRLHRTTPTFSHLNNVPYGGFSLPNIAEGTNESSESGSSISTAERNNVLQKPIQANSTSTSRLNFISSPYQKDDPKNQTDQKLLKAQSQEPLYFTGHDYGEPSTLRTGPKTQLLYPPGSLEHIASEKVPAERVKERVVYENKPIAPSLVAVNISEPDRNPNFRRQSTANGRSSEPPRRSRKDELDDYKNSLSPSFVSSGFSRQQPKSILKQSVSSQRNYSRSDYAEESSSRQSVWQQDQYFEPEMSNASLPYARDENFQSPDKDGYQQYSSRPNSVSVEMQSEEGRFRIMQENLRRHRQRSVTPQHRYPQTSFNGPFFRLEEVAPYRSQSTAPVLSRHESSEEERYQQERVPSRANDSSSKQNQPGDENRMQRMKMMSMSETEITRNNTYNDNQQEEEKIGSVVIWPPSSEKTKPREVSSVARNITDPDRIDEYRKQKQMELDAIRRREEEMYRYRKKQLHAIQLQQQRLYYQQNAGMVNGPVEMIDTLQINPEQTTKPNPAPTDQSLSTEITISSQPQQNRSRLGEPQMRVFETRPISALSESTDPLDFTFSPVSATWKRTYVVEPSEPAAKNEILTSNELLEKDRFDVDLLKRRAAFIEKPEPEPEIMRTGKRWQPPPEQPYIWPTVRRPISVEPGHEPTVDFAPGSLNRVPKAVDDSEYKWEPIVYETEYKKERKNFTPTNSPPLSPRRGMGTGPLDDVAKRQTKYLIQPSPDGSHRPKPAFGGPRATPSGGFLPHAPNGVKIVRKLHAPGTLSPSSQGQETEDVEILHQNNFHCLDLGPLQVEPRSRSVMSPQKQEQIADWEKIYDLPPHSSTITGKDVPRNIDVKRRLALFESAANDYKGGQRQTLRRPVSADSYPAQMQNSQQQRQPQEFRKGQQQVNAVLGQQAYVASKNSGSLLRRMNATPESKTIVSVPAHGKNNRQSQQPQPQQQHLLSIKPDAASYYSPQMSQVQDQQPLSATAQRRLMRMAQLTMPSPPPPSYERARPYVPAPLPPGYKVSETAANKPYSPAHP